MIGLLGMFFLVFPAVGTWGMSKWLSIPSDDRQINAYFWIMLAFIVGGLLMFILLSIISVRVLKGTNFKNYDPDNPTLHW
ncbi:hypothetical protein NT6N_24500 [Oceaniferula spumae]|uniref:Cytochrome oxidase subunit I profile domain-containing protein n=1 Tax=Oceaniferula spumae TaxID=2979115 RepID=A0AAT9FN43_9BACT